jgi:hypothetical protein
VQGRQSLGIFGRLKMALKGWLVENNLSLDKPMEIEETADPWTFAPVSKGKFINTN